MGFHFLRVAIVMRKISAQPSKDDVFWKMAHSIDWRVEPETSVLPILRFLQEPVSDWKQHVEKTVKVEPYSSIFSDW